LLNNKNLQINTLCHTQQLLKRVTMFLDPKIHYATSNGIATHSLSSIVGSPWSSSTSPSFGRVG